eukprot:Blabericola_migrator_1__12212@NODE_759_length_6627_cov_341_339177_g175_i3_p7_GENE_NODE_759_length_6627_cov_341_339177_g175_i3NODE_759_length_6627_cov_341_339177_g175_i3_p7_ORF_typecomplete_len119_score28_79_NODE_759_length_6627_cov_341_339177_g175_i327573113
MNKPVWLLLWSAEGFDDIMWNRDAQDPKATFCPNRLFIELLDSPVMDIADEHVALIYQTVKEAAMERLLNKHLKYTYEKLMFWEYFGDKLCNLMNADVYDPVKKKCVKSKSEIDLLTS